MSKEKLPNSNPDFVKELYRLAELSFHDSERVLQMLNDWDDSTLVALLKVLGDMRVSLARNWNPEDEESTINTQAGKIYIHQLTRLVKSELNKRKAKKSKSN